MAGPGGGPPRKSHTKSRNGCKTCKRRHIRCDETFPQCRNCTKHNCRCDYMDVAAVRDELRKSPVSPNLMMTPEIERDIENWRVTGVPPFLELSHFPQSYWTQARKTDLRLIHHIVGLSNSFRQHGLSETTVWVPKMRSFLALAQSSDFVMSSILAFSASHLAYITNSPDTHSLAFHHRGVALKGLQKAISSFSKENSESILAASILLSWQATEWSSWSSLQQGLTSVLDAMLPFWKDESELAQYLETRRSYHHSRSTMGPGFPGGVHLFQHHDLNQLDSFLAHLHLVQERVRHNREFHQHLTDLRDCLQKIYNDSPISAPSNAFERVQQLRNWLFWLPTRMLQSEDYDLGALAVLAQYFAAALVLEPLYPEIEGAYFGDMAVAPLEAIDQIFLSQKPIRFSGPEFDLAHSLIDYPRHVLMGYKSSHDMSYQPRLLSQLSSTPTSHYSHFSDASASSSSPAMTASAPYVTYTSAGRSPSLITSPHSPYTSSSQYGSMFGHHHSLYPDSPLHSDPGEERLRLVDFHRGGAPGHLSPYSPPYTDSFQDGGLPAMDHTSGVNIGFLHEAPMMHIGSVAPTALWT